MAVLSPLRVIITNYPNKGPTSVTVPNIPGNDAAGTHTVMFDEELWIESSDFQEVMCSLFYQFHEVIIILMAECEGWKVIPVPQNAFGVLIGFLIWIYLYFENIDGLNRPALSPVGFN